MADSQQTNSDVATDYATLRYVIKQLLARVATCTLVKVIACTNDGGVSPVGTVDVLPVIDMATADGTTWQYGTLFKLPYMRLQGGTFAVILDPKPGDLGVAMFASRDISIAKSSTGRAQLQGGADSVPPGSKRQFDLSDGLYIGGWLNGDPEAYVRFAESGVEVVSPVKVTIQAPTIELKGPVVQTGGDASFSGTVTAATDVIGGGKSLKTHTHGGVTTGGGTTGPPT